MNLYQQKWALIKSYFRSNTKFIRHIWPVYYSLWGVNISNEAVACGAWVRLLLESVQRVWSCECLGWIMECVDVNLCLDLDWTILYLLNLQCAAVCSPLPCCRHTGQLSLVPSLSGILHAIGWAIFVWWCRSRVILLGQIRVFLYKLSYTFSLRRCKDWAIYCASISTLDHIGVPPLDLSPLAVAPQSLGRPLLVLMPLSFLPLPPTSLIIGIKQQLSVLMLSFKRTLCAQV